MAEKFIVKHYCGEEQPIVKGNGFDGLPIGESKEEAEEFISFINKLIDDVEQVKATERERCADLLNKYPFESVDYLAELIRGLK